MYASITEILLGYQVLVSTTYGNFVLQLENTWVPLVFLHWDVDRDPYSSGYTKTEQLERVACK